MLHVGQKRAPQHAKQACADDLVFDRHEREVERLGAWPVHRTDFECVEELGADLLEQNAQMRWYQMPHTDTKQLAEQTSSRASAAVLPSPSVITNRNTAMASGS